MKKQKLWEIRFQFIIFNQMTLENTKEAPFLKKISSILQDQTYKGIIKWDASKTMIHIISIQKMEEEILPKFFRHKRFQSFIRQLNLYGFKKVRKSSGNVFTHDKLLEGKEILSIISKKNENKTETRQTIRRESEQEDKRPIEKQIKRQDDNTYRSEGSEYIHRMYCPGPCMGYMPQHSGYPFGYQPQPPPYYTMVKPVYNVFPYPQQHPGVGYDNYQYSFY